MSAPRRVLGDEGRITSRVTHMTLCARQTPNGAGQLIVPTGTGTGTGRRT